MKTLTETELNLLSEGAELEGKICFEKTTRIHGVIRGEIRSLPGTTLILAETGMIEGTVEADEVIIQGYIHGDVICRRRIHLAPQGRVVGTLTAPQIAVDFGAYLDGSLKMEKSAPEAAAAVLHD